MNNALEVFLGRLKGVRSHGDQHMAPCPAHEDHAPSLSVGLGTEGHILLHCFAGCTPEDVVRAMGLTTAALMPVSLSPPDNNGHRSARTTISSVSGSLKRRKTHETAADAVASLESTLGRRTCAWTFTNAAGEPVGVVVRWDHSDSKTFRAVSRRNGHWVAQAMPSPRPLFHLVELLALPASDTVYVNEGEKAVEAAREIKLPATTSAHGSQSAAQTDWSPMAGRHVVIIPDNDIAGAGYAETVIACMAKLNPPPTIRILELPELPEGGDIVDYIANQRAAGLDDATIKARIESLAQQAAVCNPARPARQVRRWRAFPVKVLPKKVREFVTEHARAMNCDPAFLTLPLLATLAACVGMTRVARLKRAWREPCVVWTAIVTPSGTLKTPTMAAALKHLRKVQLRELEEYEQRRIEYEQQLQCYEKDLSEWKKGKSGGEPPSKPLPPVAVRFIVSDTTVEALAPILLANPRGLLMERDELAGWLGDFDRYSKSPGGDVVRWLSAWSAEPIIIDRRTGGTIFISRAAISVTGTIQPEVLARVLGVHLRQNGLAARVLMAMPPRRPSPWTDADVSMAVESDLAGVVDRLLSLQPVTDEDGRTLPADVPLANDARVAFIDWYNAHEIELAGEMGDLAAALSKVRGYAARLALLIQLTRWASGEAGADAIDLISMEAAITLVEWFKHESRRVYSVLNETDENRQRRLRADVVERNGGAMSVRDWQNLRSLATSGAAEAELRDLEKAGFGTLQPAPQRGRGRPSMIFTLARSEPSDTDNNPAHASGTAFLSVSEACDERGNDERPCSGETSNPGDTNADWGEL